MATVDKAFRVKNGLIVEGSSATVNGSNVLTEASTEFLQDTTAAMFTGGTSTGISFTYNDSTGVIDAAVSADPIFADKITFEGTTPDAHELILQVIDPTMDVTVTLPNATDTLVGKATTDTLTNKTLTSPKINEDVALTATATELNYVDGVTSAIQTQINSKQATIIAGDGLDISGANLTVNSGEMVNKVVNGVSGNSYGIVGNALYLDVTNPTGYNSEIDVDIAALETKLSTDGYITTSSTSTLTNKTISGASNTITNIANGSLDNSAITINGTSTSLGGTRTLVTDDIAEDGSPTNLWFTNERAQDAVAQAIANGTQTNITITYDDNANSLSFNASGGVSSIAGTANQITASASTGAVTLSLPSAVTFPGTVTLNADPTQALQAATKQYVDSVAQGLNVHAACRVATTDNVNLSTALEAGDTVDGVTLVAGDRVLVKSQSTSSQNGIYVVQASGAAVRAADFDTPTEIVPGDFTFVSAGSTYDNTGWVQTATVTTVGTDPIVFEQFSGAGTYAAGNGLTLTGNTFSINTGVTVDLNTAQTLTNKTLTSPVLNTPSISGPLVLGNNIVVEGTDDTHETTLTFTDPTQDNTITFKNASGTLAFTTDIESAIDTFGGAVVGGTGITAAYNSGTNVLTVTNTDLGSSQNIFKNVVVGGTTVVADSNNDTLTLTAGSGISLTANATTDTVDIANSGVLSITGTANQITASGSTGAVTLSLPQSIATTSSPTFAALSVGSGSLTAGSVTLTDALIGTAVASLTTTAATVVDTWSATSYNSAKYVVQMKNGTDIEVLEVLVTIDGNNNVYLTEYADVISNAQIGTTDADYSGGNVRLLVTSTNGTTVKVHKTLIEA